MIFFKKVATYLLYRGIAYFYKSITYIQRRVQDSNIGQARLQKKVYNLRIF